MIPRNTLQKLPNGKSPVLPGIWAFKLKGLPNGSLLKFNSLFFFLWDGRGYNILEGELQYSNYLHQGHLRPIDKYLQKGQLLPAVLGIRSGQLCPAISYISSG